jgi:hypothetical protein
MGMKIVNFIVCMTVLVLRLIKLKKFLKSTLVYVYVDLYSDNHYLSRFDKGIISYIKDKGFTEWEDRTLIVDGKRYDLFDIDWVLNNKLLSAKEIKRIEQQDILI